MTGMTINGDLVDDLDARGLIHSTTDRAALEAHLSEGPATVYCGFDPTADSLHVGHLLGLLGLRRFQDAGHRPLALAGGATGMVGDPSGRSDERNLLDADALAHNLSAMSHQIARILGDDGGWDLVNNADWTADITLLDFLRDVGKHATVNQMIAKESVKARMAGDAGISFTEFSYMLLQANDFHWLRTNRECTVQIGGSDQWGNITAGIDLIRRRGAGTAYGLTWPLLLRADGTKFGKSAAGESVWLDPARTSPYAFYQFWMHSEDDDVQKLLFQLTLVPTSEVIDVVRAHSEAPGKRLAQSRLAAEVTSLVHGLAATETAQVASQLLFGGEVADAPREALEMLVDEVPTLTMTPAEVAAEPSVAELLVKTSLCQSAGDARRTITQGGGYVNGVRSDADTRISSESFLHTRYSLLRKGRKSYALLVCEP